MYLIDSLDAVDTHLNGSLKSRKVPKSTDSVFLTFWTCFELRSVAATHVLLVNFYHIFLYIFYSMDDVRECIETNQTDIKIKRTRMNIEHGRDKYQIYTMSIDGVMLYKKTGRKRAWQDKAARWCNYIMNAPSRGQYVLMVFVDVAAGTSTVGPRSLGHPHPLGHLAIPPVLVRFSSSFLRILTWNYDWGGFRFSWICLLTLPYNISEL